MVYNRNTGKESVNTWEKGRISMTAKEGKGKRLNQYAEDYVIFDLETTGVSTKEDSIIEISAVKVKNHKPTEEYSTLINPGRHIPEGASRVNGITDDLVKEAPDLKTALPEFLSFIGSGLLVGHNIHTFDMIFLIRDARQALGVEVENDYVDTLPMARMCLPQLKHHRLTDIAQHFSITTDGAHRALFDCRMNQLCYEELGKLLQSVKVESCPRCGGEVMRRKGRFGQFFGCSNYPKCRYTRNL